jgi:hypothetical protein
MEERGLPPRLAELSMTAARFCSLWPPSFSLRRAWSGLGPTLVLAILLRGRRRQFGLAISPSSASRWRKRFSESGPSRPTRRKTTGQCCRPTGKDCAFSGRIRTPQVQC